MTNQVNFILPQREGNDSSHLEETDPEGFDEEVGEACSDIVFVIDTTGSMSGKIAELLASCQKFVEELGKKQTDWRIAIVAFGDLTVRGDKIVATSFSPRIEVVKKSLSSVPRFSGGGNTGESSLEAIDKALGLPGYRPDAIKVLILLTDEPALQHQLSASGITGKLIERGILTFVISGPEVYFQKMAQDTGGKWWQISSEANFMEILERLSETVSQTVQEVQIQAGGDVQAYLQLKGSE